MQINAEAIKQRLFADPVVRARIVRDYGIDFEPENPHEFASAVLRQLEQEPTPRPLEQEYGNGDVFRAAVRALGSNSRAWATFLRHEQRLCDLLNGYDPVLSHHAAERGELTLKQLKACLPGLSSSKDAQAILDWARLLTEIEYYYGFIQDLGAAFRRMGEEQYGEPVSDVDLMLCIAGYLGQQPPKRWKGSRYLSTRRQHVRIDQHKAPGMRYILVSEFLRNLRWDGFKPDRHVQRLFDRWFSDRGTEIRDKAQRLQALIGRKTKDLNIYLTYSLVGAAVAPEGVPLSQLDNLVWLLGAYAEKQGRESAQDYLTETA